MATISQPIQQFGLILCGILLQVLLLAIERTAGCFPPPGWESKDIKERMREATAEIVIKGVVLKHYPSENIPLMGGDVYSARIQVLCVYKGPIIDERVTVAGFGESEDCVTTNVRVGDTYIIIMMPFEDRYRIVEVNQQIAVQGWSSRSGPIIERGNPCQDPLTLPPTTPMPTTNPIMTTEDMTLGMTTESGRRGSTTFLTTKAPWTTGLENEEITAKQGMSVHREEQSTDPKDVGCKSSSAYSILLTAFVILRIAIE